MEKFVSMEKLIAIKEFYLSGPPDTIWDKEVINNWLTNMKYSDPPKTKAKNAALEFLHIYLGGNSKDLRTSVITLLYAIENKGIKLIPSRFRGTTDLPAVEGRKPDTSLHQLQNTYYTGEDLKKWTFFLVDSLIGDNDETSQRSINYVGYLAATCLRLGYKSQESLANHIVKYTNSSYSSIFDDSQWALLPSPPPPSASFRDKWCMSYHAGDESDIKELLAVMVTIYTDEEKSSFRSGFAQESCLKALKFHGMGLLSSLIQASQKLKIEPHELLEYYDLENYRRSRQAVLNTINEYAAKDDQTYAYARLFNNTCFRSISTKKNQELVYGFLFIANSKEITSIVSINLFDWQKVGAKLYAERVLDAIRKRNLKKPTKD